MAIAALYLNYNSVIRAGNVSKKYIVYSLVPRERPVGRHQRGHKSMKPWFGSGPKDVEIRGSVTAPGDLVVVLAIGESSRSRNFSLYGYKRKDTNPVLQQVSGLHLLNGIARRGSTLYALPEILEKADVKLPTIVSKLGIPTACYVNYTLYDNCEAVGEVKVEPVRARRHLL